jgi:hypothetical protein
MMRVGLLPLLLMRGQHIGRPVHMSAIPLMKRAPPLFAPCNQSIVWRYALSTSAPPNLGLLVMLEVEVIGDGTT